MTSFWRNHLVWPTLVWALLVVAEAVSHGDLWLADRIFQLEGGQWLWREHWLTSAIFHSGGRRLVAFLVVMTVLGLCWFLWRGPRIVASALGYLLVSVVVATLVIGQLKGMTAMDCPWDLLRYGGDKAYYGLFEVRPEGWHPGRCFPAGHASGGYAWLALYFAAMRLPLRLRWRWFGLAFALILGVSFGIAQQLRGAHFLSHDLWTLAICWWLALAVHRLWPQPRLAISASSAAVWSGRGKVVTSRPA